MSITVTCRECGQTSVENSGDLEFLARERLCFACNHWTEMLALRDDERVARIGGRHYMAADKGSKFPGSYGRRHVIRFADGREMVSSNLWFQGEIPPHFRDRLTDNAEFVEEPKAA